MNNELKMRSKEVGRGHFKVISWNFLGSDKENTKNLNQHSFGMSQNLKNGPSEYKQQH